ncbi:WD40 repeat domain-containing protein [Alteromonas gracilis]|uniref:WD40 repeat domain-containing protein n=1 Tax=Alteromonas gracilis TaxID=1479524 RepID=UPI003735688D
MSGCTEVTTFSALSERRLTDTPLRQALLSEDSTLAVFIHHDSSVSVWDIDNNQQRFSWKNEGLSEEELGHLSLSQNNKWLAVAGYWSTTLIDLHSGNIIGQWEFNGKIEGATTASLQLSNNGDHALVGMTDGTVLHLNFKKNYAIQYHHHEMSVNHVGYTNDGMAFSGSIDKSWFHWDLTENAVLQQREFRSRVTATAYDAISQRVFVSDALKSHEIIDLTTNTSVAELKFFENFRFFRKGHFLENGKLLVTSSPKAAITLWNAETGEELASGKIKRLTSEATTHAITTNNDDHLVTLSSDGVLQEWDYRSLLHAL